MYLCCWVDPEANVLQLYVYIHIYYIKLAYSKTCLNAKIKKTLWRFLVKLVKWNYGIKCPIQYAPESNHHDCNFNSTPNIPTPIPTDKKIGTNDSLTIGVGLVFWFRPPPESGSSQLWIGLSRARVLLEAIQNWGKFYPTFPVSNGIDKCYKSLVPCAPSGYANGNESNRSHTSSLSWPPNI